MGLDRVGRLGAHTTQQDRFVNLVSRMSHDLKAPVHAMSELATWIEEELSEDGGGDRDTIADYVALLKSRSARAEALITNLRIYAQVGQAAPLFEGNWDALLARVATNVPALARFDLSTRLQGIPTIGATDLEVLTFALMSNATKHHHIGQGQICLSCERQGARHILTVADDGPGIPEIQRTGAIDMFVTLNRQDKVEGSGLGLPIAQRIAEHYGGGLTISTAPGGQGCCVTVWFPA